MTEITDDFMRRMIAKTKNYSAVFLSAGPNKSMVGVEKIIWEHARRNFSLRAEGLLSIVCPFYEGSPVSALGIFNLSIDDTKKVMDEDPGVKAGVFTYAVHGCRSFPGDVLP